MTVIGPEHAVPELAPIAPAAPLGPTTGEATGQPSPLRPEESGSRFGPAVTVSLSPQALEYLANPGSAPPGSADGPFTGQPADAADRPTATDLDEESADQIELRTRQEFGTQSLLFANQQQQSILASLS